MVGSGERGDHLETRTMRVPARITLRMLRCDPRGNAVRPAEYHRATHLPARHIAGLRGRIDDLIHSLHGKIKGHEFDNRSQPGKAGADPKPGEALLGDRRINHPAGPEFLKQALAHLIGALILADLLTEKEDRIVASHLLGHRIAQRLTYRHD